MGDFSLPPDYPTIPAGVYDEAKLVKLARQIAMGIKDLPDILFDNGLTLREFDIIKQLPAFGRMLEGEVKAFEGAANTHGRIQLRSASMIEEYLPELYARLNDPREPLMAKIKALELAAKLAGYSERPEGANVSPGDRVQVVINLGADMKSEYVKVLPHKVIEHEAAPAPAANYTFEQSLDTAMQEGLNASAD